MGMKPALRRRISKMYRYDEDGTITEVDMPKIVPNDEIGIFTDNDGLHKIML